MVAAFALAACALTLLPLCSSKPVSPTTNATVTGAPKAGTSKASAASTSSPTASAGNLTAHANGNISPQPLANPISPGFPYGSQKVRGVNLGGWLVLEVSFTLTACCLLS